MTEFFPHIFPYNCKEEKEEEILMKKRTLRSLYITLYKPKRAEMHYLISTTGSIDLPNETARIFGFRSFEEFTHYMWAFDAPTHINRIYSTNTFRVERNNEQIARLSYSDGIAETPANGYYAETPILIQITNPELIPLATSLISSKTV